MLIHILDIVQMVERYVSFSIGVGKPFIHRFHCLNKIIKITPLVKPSKRSLGITSLVVFFL